eukprot:PRCOL_00005999-RA
MARALGRALARLAAARPAAAAPARGRAAERPAAGPAGAAAGGRALHAGAEVAGVANLARVELKEGEGEKVSERMEGVLEWFDELQQVDVEGVPPATRAGDGHAPPEGATQFRADEPVKCADQDALLAAAPVVEDGYFRVPQILGEAEG